MAKSNKERQRTFRQNRKNSGLVRQDVWAFPKHWPKIKQLEKELHLEGGFYGVEKSDKDK